MSDITGYVFLSVVVTAIVVGVFTAAAVQDGINDDFNRCVKAEVTTVKQLRDCMGFYLYPTKK